MSVPMPAWLNSLKKDQVNAERLRTRFLIKTAALYYSPGGQLEVLADGCGCSYAKLVGMYAPAHGIIPLDFALTLERAVGEQILPRELIRPDGFRR